MSFMMGEVQYKIYTVRLQYFSLKLGWNLIFNDYQSDTD